MTDLAPPDTTNPSTTSTAAAAPGHDGEERARARRLNLLIAALILFRLLTFTYLVASHQDTVDGGIAGDVRRYEQMATAEGVPYRDFQVEYPPVTFAVIKLTHGPSLGVSITLVAISQLLCDILISFILRWVWSVRTQAAYLVLGLPLVAFPFVYARVDLATVLLVVIGLALVRRSKDASGGAVLAIAVLAKLWPFAVAPVLLVERRWRGVIALVVTGTLILAGWLALAGTSGIQQVFSFRDATGWQVESLPGILWHLRDPSRIKFESGAFRTGIMPLWARPALNLVSLLFIGLAWWGADLRRRRGAGDHVVYAVAPLASVLSLLIFAPILSPQYIVWMLPFAAIIVARGDRLVAGLTLAITTITTISYITVPSAAEGALYGTLPVLTRNLLLVALFVVALQELSGLRRPGKPGPWAETAVGTDGVRSSSSA
jgi:hypothetical protein